MSAWQPLRPDELDAPGSDHDVTGGDEALRIGRELESASILDPVQARADFVDSVMAAIEREPAPRAGLAILGPIRHRGPRGLVESVRAAVAMTTLGAGRPFAARAMALGYLVVVGAVGLALSGGVAVGAAGALGLLDGRSPEPTPLVQPSPSSSPEESASPSIAPSPSPSPSPSESAEPSGSPDASASPSGSPGPTKSPKPSASPDESESPQPSDSPEASRTPRPSDTPDPSESP